MSFAIKLALSITGCLLIGVVGSFATQPSLEPWYANLRKPPLTPPNEVFGPAWGVLFIAMGVALALLLEAPAGPVRTLALVLFAVQLVLNTAWSLIFFTARSPGWAIVEIVPFLAAVVSTGLVAGQVSPLVGILFVPYVAWVSFATYLNVGIWLLNRETALS